MITTTLECLTPDLALPKRPRDGDCIRWEPVITNLLSDATGLPAIRVVVFGWICFDQSLIGFMHSVTQVEDIIVDVTARQFDPDLPQVWVAMQADYCARMGRLPGIDRVTLGLEAGSRC